MDINLKLSHRHLEKSVLPILKTGDIILSYDNGLIVWFMSHFQDDPVRWGHCLIVKNNAEAWEANWRLRTVKLDKFFKNKKYWRIARKNDLEQSQRDTMLRTAPKLLGKFYGVHRIFLQFLDHIFKTNWFSSKDENIYNQVCSSFVAWIYDITCGYKFNEVPWMSCDPDDIEDDWEKHPERWVILAEQLP